MKHRMSMLRRIVSVTVIGIIIFLVSGIMLSLKWPTHWNFMLGSLFLSIIASFMGILVGILVAILVVERYLGHQRREAERKEALREAAYQARWQAYLHGGLSVLSALITHLALFVAYGKNKYLELLEARGGTADVPETIGDFVPWLAQNLQTGSRRARKEESSENDSESRGMDEGDADRLAKVFMEVKPSEMDCSRKDLSFLKDYLHHLTAHLRDQIFLFQPFMESRMGLAVALVKLAHSLDDAVENIEGLLTCEMPGMDASSIHLGEKFASAYCGIGQEAIQVIRLIWDHARDIGHDFTAKGTDQHAVI